MEHMTISTQTPPGEFSASTQDGTYPRPQLVRRHWHELAGAWGFAFDDADEGEGAHWYRRPHFDRSIQVPFPFESAASGIQDTGFHRTIWYARSFGGEALAAAGFEQDPSRPQRLHLHFGAVDYRARVWVDSSFLGEHEGGQTPFSFDITDVLDPAKTDHTVVVRAVDDPLDAAQPRGKQDWRLEPHSIWYHRTSGIWQPVWLESTAPTAVTLLHWLPDRTAGTVTARVTLNRRPPAGSVLSYALTFEGAPVAELSHPVTEAVSSATIVLPARANGQAYEELLWSPETPRLIDATVRLTTAGTAVDEVHSYLGLRSVAATGGRFLLNDRPYYVRSVLQQGYWPESHLASPSPASLRRDVELIKDLGFNATRVHQKIEDPRFLYWADRLGLLVWGEAPGAFGFSADAMRRTTAEWTAVLERDLSHPSIVTWVPINESWGVPHLAHDPAQAAFVRALAALTHAIDPTRPVVSNDGWEHVDSDILTVHDYEADGPVLAARYRDDAALTRLLAGAGPAGRRLVLPGQDSTGRPVLLTEFGGISFPREGAESAAWGYSSAGSTDDFLARLTAVLAAVHESTALAGFCYTQLTDTRQETNGLLDEDRVPKAPIDRLRALIRHGRPD